MGQIAVEPTEAPVMILEKLIVIRHGEPEKGGVQLGKVGEEQIQHLAENLKPFLEKFEREEVIVFSGTYSASSESAETLCSALGIPTKEEKCYLNGETTRESRNVDLGRELIKLRMKTYKAIIVVAHFQQCKYMVPEFAENVLRIRALNKEGLSFAEAWVLDCKEGNLTKIKRNQ
jgi:hypothetical protein